MKYIITEAPATINCIYVYQYRIDSKRNTDTDDMNRDDYYLWAAVADINCGATHPCTVQLCPYRGDQFYAIRVLGVVNDFLTDESQSYISIPVALKD